MADKNHDELIVIPDIDRTGKTGRMPSREEVIADTMISYSTKKKEEKK